MNPSKVLAKARHKVILRLVLFFVFLIAYYIGILFLFDFEEITIPLLFESYFLMEVMGESLLTLLVFFYASTGRGGSRALLNLLVLVQGLLCLIPIGLFFVQPNFLLFEFSWFIALIVKAFGFYFLSGWMHTDPWARYFFTHQKEARFQQQIHAPQPERKQPTSQQLEALARQAMAQNASTQAVVENPQPVQQPAAAQRAKPARKKKSRLDYPMLAIRLAVVLYGELIVFPILVQLFSEFFASLDGRYVFATRWIFNDCLISALLWTWSIFFLYLNMRQAKRILSITLVLQAAATLYFLYNLFTVYTGITEYPVMVYIDLIVIDLVRLALLIWSFLPVFRLPLPRQKREVDLEELMES